MKHTLGTPHLSRPNKHCLAHFCLASALPKHIFQSSILPWSEALKREKIQFYPLWHVNQPHRSERVLCFWLNLLTCKQLLLLISALELMGLCSGLGAQPSLGSSPSPSNCSQYFVSRVCDSLPCDPRIHTGLLRMITIWWLLQQCFGTFCSDTPLAS